MPRLLGFFLLTLLALAGAPSPARAAGWPGNNDNFFPSAAKAKPYINFDNKGFLIHGKRVFIAAGALHYSRVPRAMWRDRLLRIKRSGYNAIQTYAFWNYHETREGKFDFSGDKDFDAYLKLIHSLGMYAIVRVGPYVNAEWDSGGWPVWLRFKPGVSVREDNPAFLKYMDRWLNHLMPIVAANQISRGGSVIMVQLENEDLRGAGTDLPNAYFVHLRNKCLALGLEVPHFFSGLNHNDDPAGDTPWDSATRTTPWYSTEFWTGWIRVYGAPTPERALKLVRTTWKVIGYGGNGYSHYTIAGGTDWDNWSCDQQGASYDFGAPIGQGGDLRDVLYPIKRAALFATSFPDVLENSTNTTDQHQNDAPNVRVVSRTSPAGTILFLDNPGGGAATTQVKGSMTPLTLAPGEIMPMVENYALAPGIKLDRADARILSLTTDDNLKTLVIYGLPGQPAELHFTVAGNGDSIIAQAGKTSHLASSPGHVTLKTTFPASGLQTDVFHANGGKTTVRIVTESTDMADRTWFGQTGDQSWIVAGPDYVGESRVQDGHLTFETERRRSTTAPQPAFLLTDALWPQPLPQTARAAMAPATQPVPTLKNWSMAPGDPEAQPGYKDLNWKAGANPLPMGADGDPSAYAWYRTTIHAPNAGTFGLNISDAGDWLSAFVNGRHADSTPVQQRFKSPVARSMSLKLNAGDNSVAILAAHYGREKLHAYIGPIDTIDAKGIAGTVTLVGTPGRTVAVSHFRWKADSRGEAGAGELAAPVVNTTGAGWSDATIGTDVFPDRKPGFVWLRTTLENVPGPHRTLHFDAVDDNATIFLNGKKLLHHEGYNEPFDVPLESAWQENGPNVLAVLDENTNGNGGIFGAVNLQGVPDKAGANETPLQGWRMRGGITRPADTSPAWKPLAAAGAASGTPMFFRAQFTLPPAGAVGPRPVLRAGFAGLSRGFMWLNGHSIGRYPELSPVDGLYLLPCWLQGGENTLVVFDEEGQSPTQVKIFEEEIASRTAGEVAAAKGVGHQTAAR